MPILVVDDNEDLAESLAEILHSEFPSHELSVGHDGEHALRLAEAHRPRVVVMDLEMPVMGGVAAAREMRRRMPEPPKLTLIAMTGNPAAANTDDAREAFDHLLDKPVDIDRLLRLVAAA